MARGTRRWLIVFLGVRSVATVGVGLVLVLWPVESVRTLTRVIGWILLVLGTIDLLGSVSRPASRTIRWLVLARGVVTVVLGVALVLLTDASLTVAAILVGMQLVVGGGVSILLGVWAEGGTTSLRVVVMRGAFTVSFGAALIAWPDKSVTAVAIAIGVQWVLSGLVTVAIAAMLGLRRGPEAV